MNSACSPFAVCSVTHGAIFAAADGSFGQSAGFVARDELIAARTATAVAPRNNEQEMGRHHRINVRFVFAIIIGGWSGFAQNFSPAFCTSRYGKSQINDSS